ncbi:GlsB/YeaQ/YmgE family stress response membrane protein [Streptococcus agalactiae]|nr:GlsB/YeaQ/YmgE family stress response membrane protein [Streptococcus agalactiae]
MSLIWSLIVGAIIGAIAGAVTNKGGSMGWIDNILAGLVCSFFGKILLGTWGPKLAGMALIPSIVGAIIVVIVTSFVLGKMNN